MEPTGHIFTGELAWRPEDTLESWGKRFLFFLREHLPFWAAVLYAETEENTLERIATYAVLPKDFPFIRHGEGIVGESARQQRAFLYPINAEVKEGIGLAEVRPVAYWVYPWVYQGRTWAVLETLLWRELEEAETRWLQENTAFLGMLLSSVLQQEQIRRLLEFQRKQNRRLEENLKRLSAMQKELSELNASLEERVRQRTMELEKALSDLNSAQQQLVLSEKMAALGQLVAGIAHEINSPLGAIKGSAETLLEAIPTLWQLLLTLGNKDWQAMQQALSFLIEYLRTPNRLTLTSREERALRRKYFASLSATLPEEEAESTARRLVEAGIFVEDLTPLLPLLRMPDGVELTYLIGQLRLQLDNILLAANRTRKTVFALKSYAYTSDQGKPVPTSLEESIETILVLYHNQLKQGVVVHTQYEPELPTLYLFADEIGQVWTNLLQNAIQAMQGKGELTIRVRRRGEEIQVSFIDTGPGIPEEVLPRIFEPFFTTKPKGEGTGLGLDICQRIVEKHKGRISVESRPGYTNFTVHLPLLLTQEDWYERESHPQRV